jgi:hypothetical protein
MVYVLGITHAEFGALGPLRREYTLYDETAIWKQILLQEALGDLWMRRAARDLPVAAALCPASPAAVPRPPGQR